MPAQPVHLRAVPDLCPESGLHMLPAGPMVVDLDIRRLQRRDATEWTKAFRRARQLAARKLWGRTAVDFQDVAQDACLRLQADLDGLLEQGYVDAGPALHRSVRFAALDALRAEARRRGHDTETGQAHVELLTRDLAELQARREALASSHTREEVSRVFASADGQLLLRWFEGDRLVEIQRDTGLSLATIHGRIRRAANLIATLIDSDTNQVPHG